jgi:exoribonuclease R
VSIGLKRVYTPRFVPLRSWSCRLQAAQRRPAVTSTQMNLTRNSRCTPPSSQQIERKRTREVKTETGQSGYPENLRKKNENVQLFYSARCDCSKPHQCTSNTSSFPPHNQLDFSFVDFSHHSSYLSPIRTSHCRSTPGLTNYTRQSCGLQSYSLTFSVAQTCRNPVLHTKKHEAIQPLSSAVHCVAGDWVTLMLRCSSVWAAKALSVPDHRPLKPSTKNRPSVLFDGWSR